MRWLLLLLLPGCALPDGFALGPDVSCATPREGWDRLRDEGAQRGLDLVDVAEPGVGGGCLYIPGGVVAHDLDGDGDVDLAFADPGGLPHLYENDGQGQFQAVLEPGAQAAVQGFGRPILGVAAVDIDGDGLPELALSGEGIVLLLPNLGGFDFGPPEPLVLQDGYPRTCFNTMAWGDADGDLDLDLALPGLDPVDAADQASVGVPDHGTEDLLLLNEGGAFSSPTPLVPEGPRWLSLLGAFTDRDGDGDMDLLLTTDRPAFAGSVAAFYRNDGPDPSGQPRLVDDALEVGAQVRASGMGLAARDFNQDGLLDYCVTDVAPWLVCLVSQEGGAYLETGATQGLVVEGANLDGGGEISNWTGWGLAMVDLDGDGLLDAAAAAGRPPSDGSPADPAAPPEPDSLWRGQADGSFVAATSSGGWEQPSDHYGLVAADFSGDGAPDLVLHGGVGAPLFWDNPCSAGAWLEVELIGPPGNREGYGAQVVVEAGGRSERQEMQALNSVSQGPSRLHFGLGGATRADRVEVIWPGGRRAEAEGVAVDRVLTVTF